MKKILLLIALSNIILAQNSIKESIKQAEKLFDKKNYHSAYDLYSEIALNALQADQRAQALYMMALCSYNEKEYDRAITEFLNFIKSYPDHPLIPKAALYLANLYYLVNDYINSAIYFSLAMRSKNTTERNQAKEELEKLLWGYIQIEDFPLLLQKADSWSEGLIAYYWIKRLEYHKEYAYALREGRKLMQRIFRAEEKNKIKQLLDKIEQQLKERIVILAIVPQSGEFADFGKDVLRGIQLAFSQMAKNEKIELSIIDSGSDVLSAARAIKDFLTKNTPLCIIGPVTSDEVVSVGMVASAYNIPLLTPTASKDGIAELSPYIFQLVASPVKASKHLALFAADSFDTFSILAPDDPLGHACADAFIEGIREKNKELMSVVFYKEKTMDFTETISKLKEPFLKLLDRKSVYADSTDTTFYDCSALRKGCVMRDRAKWLVTTQAIFIPAYPDELETIIPQIPFMYLNARIMGTNGWVVREIAKKKSLMNILAASVFVPDDFHIEKSINEWSEFAIAYIKKYKLEPTRLSALGYDAAKIVLEGINEGALTQELMRDYIANIRNYHGAGGPISFDSNGANKNSVILKIEDSQFKRVW